MDSKEIGWLNGHGARVFVSSTLDWAMRLRLPHYSAENSKSDLLATCLNFVFPHAKYFPALGPKKPVDRGIAGAIFVELTIPEFNGRFRSDPMLRAAMPLAPIHEDHKARARKDKIWAARDGRFEAVAESHPPEGIAQQALGHWRAGTALPACPRGCMLERQWPSASILQDLQ
jgi:hypothetical protein